MTKFMKKAHRQKAEVTLFHLFLTRKLFQSEQANTFQAGWSQFPHYPHTSSYYSHIMMTTTDYSQSCVSHLSLFYVVTLCAVNNERRENST